MVNDQRIVHDGSVEVHHLDSGFWIVLKLLKVKEGPFRCEGAIGWARQDVLLGAFPAGMKVVTNFGICVIDSPLSLISCDRNKIVKRMWFSGKGSKQSDRIFTTATAGWLDT
jgi:hypothetical protein